MPEGVREKCLVAQLGPKYIVPVPLPDLGVEALVYAVRGTMTTAKVFLTFD